MARSNARTRWQTVALALCILTVLLITGGLTFRLINRTPDLMSGAVPIADVHNWFPIGGEPFYHWVSEDVLLYLDQNGPAPHLKRLRISTGATFDYGRLPFSSTIPSNPGVWARVSPDGQYLLWVNSQSATSYPRALEIESLAGVPRIIEWKQGGFYYPPFWLPDSKRWFQVREGVKNPSIQVFDIETPHEIQTRPLSSPQSMKWGGMLSNGSYFVCKNIHALSPQGDQGNKVLEVGLFTPFLDTRKPTKEIMVMVPWEKDTTDWSAREISPDGTRLLWRELRTNNRWRSLYLEVYRRLPVLPLPREMGIFQAYWVSDSTGKNLRLLGIREITVPARFSELRWTPDGRHVSFMHDGILYVRPVP